LFIYAVNLLNNTNALISGVYFTQFESNFLIRPVMGHGQISLHREEL